MQFQECSRNVEPTHASVPPPRAAPSVNHAMPAAAIIRRGDGGQSFREFYFKVFLDFRNTCNFREKWLRGGLVSRGRCGRVLQLCSGLPAALDLTNRHAILALAANHPALLPVLVPSAR